jgi:hypothetical protein
MADKSSFTPDEWQHILEGAMMASVAMTAADPSGLIGLLKESFAAGSTLAAGKTDAGSNALIKAVVADFETADGRSSARGSLKEKFVGSKPADIKVKALEALRQVAALVDAKASADAPAFKAWLKKISQNVAEAAKEGGFLGIGGVRVSDAEKATLAEISSALGS